MKETEDRHSKSAKLRESWILCFLLGVVMLNYPFLHIFNKTTSYFGIPTLILYFFVGWPLSIAVIYFFSRIIDSPDNGKPDQGPSEKEGS